MSSPHEQAPVQPIILPQEADSFQIAGSTIPETDQYGGRRIDVAAMMNDALAADAQTQQESANPAAESQPSTQATSARPIPEPFGPTWRHTTPAEVAQEPQPAVVQDPSRIDVSAMWRAALARESLSPQEAQDSPFSTRGPVAPIMGMTPSAQRRAESIPAAPAAEAQVPAPALPTHVPTAAREALASADVEGVPAADFKKMLASAAQELGGELRIVGDRYVFFDKTGFPVRDYPYEQLMASREVGAQREAIRSAALDMLNSLQSPQQATDGRGVALPPRAPSAPAQPNGPSPYITPPTPEQQPIQTVAEMMKEDARAQKRLAKLARRNGVRQTLVAGPNGEQSVQYYVVDGRNNRVQLFEGSAATRPAEILSALNAELEIHGVSRESRFRELMRDITPNQRKILASLMAVAVVLTGVDTAKELGAFHHSGSGTSVTTGVGGGARGTTHTGTGTTGGSTGGTETAPKPIHKPAHHQPTQTVERHVADTITHNTDGSVTGTLLNGGNVYHTLMDAGLNPTQAMNAIQGAHLTPERATHMAVGTTFEYKDGKLVVK